MTRSGGDLTRKWWYLFQSFPQEHRVKEIAKWISDRKVGALIALFEADKNDAIEELRSLRSRYPKDTNAPVENIAVSTNGTSTTTSTRESPIGNGNAGKGNVTGKRPSMSGWNSSTNA